MTSGSRHLDCPSLCRAAGAVLWLLLLQLSSPALGAVSCFTSGLPDGYHSTLVPLHLELDREDLLVTTQWPNEPRSADATFVLSAPGEGDVAFWPAEQAPGEDTEQRLAGALTGVAAAGFQYFLELRDPEGSLGRLTFRVAVSCADEPCEYHLVAGLESGPIAVSEAFWNAMTEARTGGATDLLASMRNEHPEVAAEIPGFAWQLQQAESRPGGGCSCRWVAVHSLSDGAFIGSRGGERPSHEYGTNFDGAAFLAGAQATAGRAEVDRTRTEGSTGLGLQLLCTADRGGNQAEYDTSWPSLPRLQVREPVISSCRAPCTPLIDHLALVTGCAEGYAVSRDNQRAWAWAEVDASGSLDGQPTIAGTALIDLDVSTSVAAGDRDSFFRDSMTTVRADGASAILHAGASLKVEALSPSSDDHSYAYSAASMEYALEFQAPATCGIKPGYASFVYALPRDDDGGVTMERWEP